MSKQEWIFIVNPVSGQGRSLQIEALVQKILRNENIRYKIHVTSHNGHAHELALLYKDKADVIVAVGGDGTVNEVGSALLFCKHTSFGIIPCGSGNGLARSLGIPVKMKESIKHLLKAKPVLIDSGLVNNKVFLCVCGFGFDARVAHAFSFAGSRGLKTYVRVVKSELKKYKPIEVVISNNDVSITEKIFILSVANGPQFGNNIYINPQASVTDSVLNLTIIKPFKSYRKWFIILAMRLGLTHKLKEFKQLTGEYFTLDLLPDEGQIDGEPFETGGKAMVSIQKSSLRILK